MSSCQHGGNRGILEKYVNKSSLDKTNFIHFVLILAIVLSLSFVVGSTIGRLFILGAIELSIPQIGIICAGVTSVSVFVRCVKKLEGRVKNVGV